MNHAIVIAGRELRDRTRLFLLAAAFALIPFVAAVLPYARANRSDVIAMGAAVLGVALAFGTAVTLGASAVGRELSDRRLSFYFSKPVSTAAVWSGKAAAGLLTSFLCFVIVVVPAYLAVTGEWRGGDITPAAIFGGVAVVIVALFFTSHAVSTMVRSRSPLIALDLACAAIAAAALLWFARTAAAAGAFDQAGMIVLGALALMVIVLAVAPLRQLSEGRTDVRRNHAALSRVVWGGVAAILVLAGAYTAWLVTPDATDIADINDLVALPGGQWALISGPVANRPGVAATFLVDRASGETVRMPTVLWWLNGFSRDGRVLAWMQPHGVFRPTAFELYVRDMVTGKNRATGIPMSVDDFVLSDDGARVAIVRGNVIAVHDVGSGKLLAAAAGLASRARHRLFFASPDVVRIYELTGRDVTVYGLSVGSRAFARLGHLPGMGEPHVSPDGTRMALEGGVVADARTATPMFALPEWKAQRVRMRMLRGGRIVRTGFAGGAIHVQIFEADGRPRHDVVLPGMSYALTSGETTEGKLIVTASRGRGVERATYVIDVERGVIERVGRGLRGAWFWQCDPRPVPLSGELLAVDEKSRPVVWTRSGETRALF